ncbi:MAG: AAA family ATPase [Candidatus Woesearchaeota archaeon]|jgi:predicted kinase|nr:AAA family ATPase [Candidatus Woesearchaeota archaeon]
MNQQILFLRGLPASGKSTFAVIHCTKFINFKRINKDSIREFMGNPPFNQKFEKLVLDIQHKAGNYLLDAGFSIIVDDTNFSQRHYNWWEKIANERDIDFVLKEFNTPVEECVQRDKNRKKPVGEDVIMNMYRKYLK